MAARLLVPVLVLCALLSPVVAFDYRLESWYAENGVTHEKLVLTSSSCKTQVAVATGDVLASVPGDQLITLQRALNSSLGAAVNDMSGRAGSTLMALYLLSEKADPESKLKPWLNSLPTDYHTPLFFSEEELKELQGSSVEEQARQRNAFVASEYAALFPALSEKYPELFPAFTFSASNFNWAYSTIYATSLSVDAGNGNSMPVLVPFVDLVPTGNDNVGFRFNQDTNTFEMVASADYAAGHELKIARASRSNAQLLLNNGITLGDENDVFTLTMSLDRLDAMADSKARILARFGLPYNNAVFTITRSGLPLNVLRLFRVHLTRPSEVDKAAQMNAFPISMRNELDTTRALLNAFARLLQQFPTSAQQDAELLASDTLTPHHRLAVQVRKGEKEVLLNARRVLLEHWLALATSEDYVEA